MDILDCEEISSMAFESVSKELEDSQIKILSSELSSLSLISVHETTADKLALDPWDSEVNSLKERLKSNVETLHQELKLYEQVNKKEASIINDIYNNEEVIDQLNGIRTKVETLKQKLKGSEELISEKVMENISLKEQLRELELRNLTNGDKNAVCAKCIMI